MCIRDMCRYLQKEMQQLLMELGFYPTITFVISQLYEHSFGILSQVLWNYHEFWKFGKKIINSSGKSLKLKLFCQSWIIIIENQIFSNELNVLNFHDYFNLLDEFAWQLEYHNKKQNFNFRFFRLFHFLKEILCPQKIIIYLWNWLKQIHHLRKIITYK